mgnify:CR=1 FL=1
MTQINKDEAQINGIPVNRLSSSGQQLFDRVIELKREADELATKHGQKEAALKEISDMLLTEVNQIKSEDALGELAAQAQADGEYS